MPELENLQKSIDELEYLLRGNGNEGLISKVRQIRIDFYGSKETGNPGVYRQFIEMRQDNERMKADLYGNTSIGKSGIYQDNEKTQDLIQIWKARAWALVTVGAALNSETILNILQKLGQFFTGGGSS